MEKIPNWLECEPQSMEQSPDKRGDMYLVSHLTDKIGFSVEAAVIYPILKMVRMNSHETPKGSLT